MSAHEDGEESSSDTDEDIEAITPEQRQAMSDEVAELRGFQQLAGNLRENSKGAALLQALARAFAELDRLGANRKALIFTESKRTQAYLQSLLADTPYGDGIVLFNGDNSGSQAQKIYKDWLQRHAGTDRITGSKTADTRAALVEHFRDQGKVMIATEAGGEGINLQFCSLVINYDAVHAIPQPVKPEVVTFTLLKRPESQHKDMGLHALEILDHGLGMAGGFDVFEILANEPREHVGLGSVRRCHQDPCVFEHYRALP